MAPLPPRMCGRNHTRIRYASNELVAVVEGAVHERDGRRLSNGEIVFTCPNAAEHSNGDAHPSARWNPQKQTWVCDVCRAAGRHAGGGLLDLNRRLGLETGDRAPAAQLLNGKRSSTNGNARQVDKTYPYHDETGTLLYEVVRYKPKSFSQRRPDGRGGWVYNLSGVRRVLYRLPELVAADPARQVLICEGEKDADRLALLGFVATTCPQGAGKWRPEYAEALCGRAVAVLADNDAAGRSHAEQVARALHAIAAEVRVVNFDSLAEKGDASDFLDEGGTADDLERLIRSAPRWEPTDEEPGDDSSVALVVQKENALPDVPPFPTEVFPEVLRRYVEEGARAMGIPTDMIAVPLLAACGGLIGNRVSVQFRRAWSEWPIFWFAVVGDPGSGKSPGLGLAMSPVEHLQRRAWEDYQRDLEQYERHRAGAGGAPGVPTESKPVLPHFFTTDATLEGLADMIGSSPGVTFVRDELVGWVRSHDAYRKAGDRQSWLSLWSHKPLKIDRRTRGPILVTDPAVTVVGGVQPDLLPDLAAEAGQHDGFLDRLDLAWPDARPMYMSDDEISEQAEAAAIGLIEQISRLRQLPPRTTRLSAAAQPVFRAWHDDNVDRIGAALGLARGYLAKLPSKVLRLAVLLHVLSNSDVQDGDEIGAATIDAAINLAEYFTAHFNRVLTRLGSGSVPKEERLADKIAAMIQNAGVDGISRWEISDGLQRHVSSNDISAALQRLTESGNVRRGADKATGGRPREVWRWVDSTTREESEERGEPRQPDVLSSLSSHSSQTVPSSGSRTPDAITTDLDAVPWDVPVPSGNDHGNVVGPVGGTTTKRYDPPTGCHGPLACSQLGPCAGLQCQKADGDNHDVAGREGTARPKPTRAISRTSGAT